MNEDRLGEHLHGEPDPGAICLRVLANSMEATFQTRDGVLEWISPTITEIAGWSDDELIGRTTLHLWHTADRAAALSMRERGRRGDMAAGRLRMRHAAGHFVWVHVRIGLSAGSDAGRVLVGSLRAADTQVARDQRLADVEQAYQLIADNARDVVSTVDTQGIVLTMSPSVEASLGWSPADLVGTFLPALVHPDDRGRLADYRRTVQSGAPAGRIEFRAQTRGGAWKWAAATAALAVTTEGAHVVVVSWRDIDDLVHEREIAEHEAQRLRAVFDSSLDPRLVMTAVRDHRGAIIDFRIDDANAKACKATGLARAHLVGRRLIDTFPSVCTSGLLDALIQAVETGEPFEADDTPFASDVMGDTRRYDIRAHSVGDSLMHTWRDVTDRARAADETADAAMHFRHVARHAGDAVVRIENDVITWSASSRHWDLPLHVGDHLGTVLSEMAHTKDQPQIESMSSALAAGTPYVGVWQVRDTRGREHVAAVRAEAVGGGVDPRTDIVITLTDLARDRAGADVDAAAADLIRRYQNTPSDR